jgi:hypothetical protein
MPTERMLVLASSRKPGGRCIAGLSLSKHALVRPVSRGSGAIDLSDCGLENYPQEFDVVTFHHEGHDGDVTQPENLLVDGTAWVVEAPMEPAQAVPLLDPLIQSATSPPIPSGRLRWLPARCFARSGKPRMTSTGSSQGGGVERR